MSEENENLLVESLIWSDNDYSLAEFVENYKLPQVVQVEEGFFEVSESTSLVAGEVLILHSLQTTKKLVCETALNNAVVIPLSCPLKVVVQPRTKDCKYAKVSANQLSSLYDQINYVHVLEEYHNAQFFEDSFQAGDVLEIVEVDSENCSVKCRNVANKQKISVPFGCTELFAPLVDYRQYTLEEVKQRFGLPVKVRFLKEETERNPYSRDQTSMLVSSLGEITVLEEIEETKVISTTVGGDSEEKICLQIPTYLPVQVTVAEGFIRDDAVYQNIVKTLDKTLNRTHLQDFQNLGDYQHIDAAKKYVQEKTWNITFEWPSDEILRKLPELKSQEFSNEPAPTLSPKRLLTQATSAPPNIPLKPAPKPGLERNPKYSLKQARKTAQKLTANLLNRFKSTRRPRIDTPLRRRRHSTGGCVELDEKPGSDFAEGIFKSDSDYDYAFPDSVDSAGYERIYEEPQWEAGDILQKGPSVKNLGVSSEFNKPLSEYEPLAVTMERGSLALSVTETDDSHGTMTRFPTDLSRLRVKEVCELLRDLHMGSYVRTFEEEMVDGEMLLSMDRESLKSLNVTAFHVKKLMKFIEGWRPNI